MLFSEPKIPQSSRSQAGPSIWVSVLFSEPKIPQFMYEDVWCTLNRSFSALQRAENSSIVLITLISYHIPRVSVLFSEPKIPQFGTRFGKMISSACFSALQRAENSSMISSALEGSCGFHVSVLFSEPKIPQSSYSVDQRRAERVSVLFSEPKIPQSDVHAGRLCGVCVFQCSSASRKFLNG